MSFVLLLVLTVAGRKETEVSAKIKTKKITIDLRGGNTAASEPEMVRKAKKVKVKSSKKSVVTVKFKKKRLQREKRSQLRYGIGKAVFGETGYEKLKAIFKRG